MHAFTDTQDIIITHTNTMWAIVNTATNTTVDVHEGTQMRAMDIAAAKSKASIGTKEGTTLYVCRAATPDEVDLYTNW